MCRLKLRFFSRIDATIWAVVFLGVTGIALLLYNHQISVNLSQKENGGAASEIDQQKDKIFNKAQLLLNISRSSIVEDQRLDMEKLKWFHIAIVVSWLLIITGACIVLYFYSLHRKKAEEEREKLLYVLGERVKELKCLYRITSLTARPGKSLWEIFQGTVDLIPGGFQYPDITCGRITYEGLEVSTDAKICAFEVAGQKLSTDIVVFGANAGRVEVYYAGEKPAADEGPFLKEERELIEAIAKAIGNIIECKLAEDRLLEEKEKAEKATDLKDKFVSLVSHDLRTPLTTLGSFMKLLSSHGELDTGSKDKILDRSIACCQNAIRMVDNILDLRKLKTGKIRPEPVFLDVHYLIIRLMIEVEPMANEKGITLVNSVPEKTRIYADKTLFYAVLQNLLLNSVKFCRKGDIIKVFIPTEEPSTVIVRDTGQGIETERQKHIFSYDVRTSTAGTAGETGSGFGLPLSHDIMIAHGGELILDSEKDKGSTFFAKLPSVRV